MNVVWSAESPNVARRTSSMRKRCGSAWMIHAATMMTIMRDVHDEPGLSALMTPCLSEVVITAVTTAWSTCAKRCAKRAAVRRTAGTSLQVWWRGLEPPNFFDTIRKRKGVTLLTALAA
jgi:hypothetical protein